MRVETAPRVAARHAFVNYVGDGVDNREIELPPGDWFLVIVQRIVVGLYATMMFQGYTFADAEHGIILEVTGFGQNQGTLPGCDGFQGRVPGTNRIRLAFTAAMPTSSNVAGANYTVVCWGFSHVG